MAPPPSPRSRWSPRRAAGCMWLLQNSFQLPKTPMLHALTYSARHDGRNSKNLQSSAKQPEDESRSPSSSTASAPALTGGGILAPYNAPAPSGAAKRRQMGGELAPLPQLHLNHHSPPSGGGNGISAPIARRGKRNLSPIERFRAGVHAVGAMDQAAKLSLRSAIGPAVGSPQEAALVLARKVCLSYEVSSAWGRCA